MDFDELELGADELSPEKPYTPERREELDELWASSAALAPEVTA